MRKSVSDEELQNPDYWDWDSAQVYPGNPNAGAVVSVRFSSKELEQVSVHAQHTGKRLTDFIREAALEKAADDGQKQTAAARPSTQRQEQR